MAVPTPTEVSINERDVLLAILEYLENHKLHITQVSLERETGSINGDYSEDILFLRQLIVDGQWDSACDFVEPLRESPDFDQRGFAYLIQKYKFFELLCIKQEPGPLNDNDFAVEEIVEVLKDLEQISPTPQDYQQLCALLTLPKFSDHVDFKGWNPSAARVECFHKVYPLVHELLSTISLKKENQSEPFACNDRLLQLVTKGVFYESCVDYCQAQALGNRKAIEQGHQFNRLLTHKPKLSANDLSLISWLEVLGNEQFTVPFQQRSLELKFVPLKRPRLEGQWSEQIMATPIKPGGQFPHSIVPNTKFKFTEKMSHSMILPPMSASYAMIESTMSNRVKRVASTHPMSQSTAGSVGFVIPKPEAENLMEQSLVISNMMEKSELTKQSRPNAIGGSSSSASIPSQLSQELSQSRRELDSITRKIQPPNSLPSTNSLRTQLAPVPELSTPNSGGAISPTNSVGTPINDAMTRSRLFQEFANRRVIPHQHQPQRMSNPYMDDLSARMMQIPMRPISTILPGQMPYDPSSYVPQPNFYPQPTRPQSYIPQPIPPQHPISRSPASGQQQSLQFIPLCRYEDAQAIRAVAFHPSGRYFAVGTNSKQLLVCKYPNVRGINLQTQKIPFEPEIGLSRPRQHRGSVYACAFSASGELLATGSNDKSIRMMHFNAENCKIGAEMELNIHDGTVRDLIFLEESSRGSILVSGGAGNCQISLTDCSTGQTFKNYNGHTAPILGLYSWGNGTSFASCSQDRTIRFWDLRAASAVNVISPNIRTSNSPVTSVCVDPSGKLLVSGHEDASIMLYDVTGSRVLQTFRPHGDEVRTVRFSNAAYYLLSGSYDKRVVITDMRGDLTNPLNYLPIGEHNDKIIQCRWHPHEFTFLSTSADKTVVLWTLPS